MDVPQNFSIQEHGEALGHGPHGRGITGGGSHREEEIGQVHVTVVSGHCLRNKQNMYIYLSVTFLLPVAELKLNENSSISKYLLNVCK